MRKQGRHRPSLLMEGRVAPLCALVIANRREAARMVSESFDKAGCADGEEGGAAHPAFGNGRYRPAWAKASLVASMMARLDMVAPAMTSTSAEFASTIIEGMASMAGVPMPAVS